MRSSKKTKQQSRHSLPGLPICSLVLAIIGGSAAVLSVPSLLSQSPNAENATPVRKPFTRNELTELLRLKTPENLLIPRVRTAGVDFIATNDDLRGFANLGASSALLDLIRAASERQREKNTQSEKATSAESNRSIEQPPAHLDSTTIGNPVEAPSTPPPVRGIAKTAFSLRYLDIVIGSGSEAIPNKLYKVHYTGWLAADGRKFDSSYDHRTPLRDKDGKPVLDADGKPQLGDPQPLTFPQGMGRIIAGFDFGFSGMRIGGKRRLFVPWQMAYGLREIPARDLDHPGIHPQSDLIFDVELIDVTDLPAVTTHKTP
jgi:peptidylprolyl isomerase